MFTAPLAATVSDEVYVVLTEGVVESLHGSA
jgi:hypothetical protein